MTSVYTSMTSCLDAKQRPAVQETGFEYSSKEGNKSAESPADAIKGVQTNETKTSVKDKVSSSVYNLGSGVMQYGYGGVKWAASTTYNVGAGIVSAGKNVITRTKEKPKAD